jgi:hypothetical protein
MIRNVLGGRRVSDVRYNLIRQTGRNLFRDMRQTLLSYLIERWRGCIG